MQQMPGPTPPPTIRGALFALLALAFVPLVLFGGWEVARDYTEHRDAETRASGELARSIAAAAEAFVQDLVRTEYAVAASDAAHGSTPAEIERVLALVVGRLPAVRDMSWLDGEGRVVASTEPQLVGKSFYGREYFQEIARGAEWRVSHVVQSVVDGRATFIVARGIRGPTGALDSVVAAAVDADAFGAVVLRERGRGGSTSLRDTNGTLVAIAPPRLLAWEDRRRGTKHEWIQRALSGREGVGVFPSPLTGERRVGAIVPLPAMGWAAHASRSFGEAMAPVRRGGVIHGSVLLAIVLASLAAALFVARRIVGPLRALEVEAGRLAQGGEPDAELRGPVEVRGVASALRAMAAGLAERRAELDRLHDERETLMRSVSHDLRTPLHVIVGHAALLRRHVESPELQHRTEAILASADRMTRLIGDLVDAARLAEGHLDLRLEAMDLPAFLAGWRERVAGALPVERVRLEVPADVPVPMVRADPARLDQILTNLVSNALKYSLPDSAVHVALAAGPSSLRLAVSDVGPGIPPEEVSRLFERYYRAKGSAGAEGLGLGLFITRKLVEAHGWRVEVHSEVGKGSVFTVVVPLDGAEPAQSSPSAVA
jgi:signal transduction histidine kinase